MIWRALRPGEFRRHFYPLPGLRRPVRGVARRRGNPGRLVQERDCVRDLGKIPKMVPTCGDRGGSRDSAAVAAFGRETSGRFFLTFGVPAAPGRYFLAASAISSGSLSVTEAPSGFLRVAATFFQFVRCLFAASLSSLALFFLLSSLRSQLARNDELNSAAQSR